MKNVQKINELLGNVEELLAELGDEQSPEFHELRVRIEDAIVSTKRAIKAQGDSAVARIGHYASSLDAFINGYPRLAFATGALVSGFVGYWAGAASRPRK